MLKYRVCHLDSEGAGLPMLKSGGHSLEINPSETARFVMKTTEDRCQVYDAEEHVKKIYRIGDAQRKLNFVNWQRLPVLLVVGFVVGFVVLIGAGDFVTTTPLGVIGEGLVGLTIFGILAPLSGFWAESVRVVVLLKTDTAMSGGGKTPALILRMPTEAYHRLFDVL